MTAIPMAAGADGPSTASRFRLELTALEARYQELWRATADTPPRLGEPVGWHRRAANARAARRLIDRLAREVGRFPSAESERRIWRRRLEDLVRGFGQERLDWPAGYRRLLFADTFFDSSVDFVRRARAFDPDLEPREIGQALRNVWIMNSLQMLLDRPIGLSPAMFGYSMLYPETDNYLDDPEVSGSAKRRFNDLLGSRLSGHPIPDGNGRRIERVSRLVGTIEGVWPRTAHPRVYESLLAIHRAQVDSLAQDRPPPAPSPGTLLALSVAKGGASVLADGYLVAGRLSAAEADFCFGYGVFLQLLDDLQDRGPDRAAGHATLFSVSDGPGLERLVGRLHRFMRRVVEGAQCFSRPRHRDPRDLIVRNCTLLLVGAVAEQPAAFSRGFRRALEERWPLRFAAMRRLRRRADRRFRRAGEELRRRRGAESALDLL